jgi:hypothetical protein
MRHELILAFIALTLALINDRCSRTVRVALALCVFVASIVVGFGVGAARFGGIIQAGLSGYGSLSEMALLQLTLVALSAAIILTIKKLFSGSSVILFCYAVPIAIAFLIRIYVFDMRAWLFPQQV